MKIVKKETCKSCDGKGYTYCQCGCYAKNACKKCNETGYKIKFVEKKVDKKCPKCKGTGLVYGYISSRGVYTQEMFGPGKKKIGTNDVVTIINKKLYKIKKGVFTPNEDYSHCFKDEEIVQVVCEECSGNGTLPYDKVLVNSIAGLDIEHDLDCV